MSIDIRGLRLKSDIFSYFQNTDRSEVRRKGMAPNKAKYCRQYETLEWTEASGSNLSLIEACAYKGIAVIFDPTKVDSNYLLAVESLAETKCFFIDDLPKLPEEERQKFSVIVIDNGSWMSLAYNIDEVYEYFFDPRNIQLFVFIG